MLRRRLRDIILPIFLILLIGYVIIPASAEGIPPDQKKERLDVRIQKDRVYLIAENADISLVLNTLARKSGMDITIGHGVAGRISVAIDGKSLSETLKILCSNRAVVYEFDPKNKSFRIIRAGAYFGAPDEFTPISKDPAASQTSDVSTGSTLTGASSGKRKPRTQTRQNLPRYTQALDSKGRPRIKAGEILVKFKPGTSEDQINRLHQTIGGSVIGKIDKIRLQKIKLKPGLAEQDAIEKYVAAPIVENAETHALRYSNQQVPLPDDPYFSELWGLTKTKTPEAWTVTKGQPETVIAVIDTGVDYLHPELKENIWINEAEYIGADGVDDDSNGYEDDVWGWDFAGDDRYDFTDADADPTDTDFDSHGTHVSGTIAARGNNGLGIVGVTWRSRIMPLKAQADNSDVMEDFDIIEAIYYAIDMGARIVNCSFGGEETSANEEDAFRALEEAGILAVCSSGNGDNTGNGINTDLTVKNYPSCYTFDNIISVAASDQSDNLAGFSNYGLTSVDLTAPGVDIESTVAADPYTQASVYVQESIAPFLVSAKEIAFSPRTDDSGISAALYDCGLGYPGDFPAEVSGNIALIQRGELYFSEKIKNSISAGAIAVIIYNNESGIFNDTLSRPRPADWPVVVAISQEDGTRIKSALNAQQTLVVSVKNTVQDEVSFYSKKQGTSMAAPHVSGVAGLLWAIDPSRSYTDVKSTILNSVDKFPSLLDRMVSGGRLNALRAVCSAHPAPIDLTGNGNIGPEDAVVALQISAGMSPSIFLPCLTLDSDGFGKNRIGIGEATYILEKASGIR